MLFHLRFWTGLNRGGGGGGAGIRDHDQAMFASAHPYWSSFLTCQARMTCRSLG